tara:strand:- start:158 stop:421 length:264 start_codon:yes stop_codon:yes gene_type:complete
MTTAVIYSNGSQECERIAQLLNALPDVKDFHRYELDEHFTKQQFEMEFGGDASYPQIQINNQHIGTMKEALHYMSKKEMLDKQRHTM